MFIWVEDIHGNIYGTLFQDIDLALLSPGLSVMQITPNAVKKLHDHLPINSVLSFFVVPPSEAELRRRLAGSGRKEFPEAIERRISDCRTWHKEARKSEITYVFVDNDGLIETTVAKVQLVIENSL